MTTTSNGPLPAVVTSTAHLTPDGALGYAKGIASTLAAVLIAVVEFLPDGDYKRWVQIAIAVLGAIATIAVPNKVKPVVVLPQGGTTNITVTVPAPAQPSVSLEPLLGVVSPPGRHESPPAGVDQ